MRANWKMIMENTIDIYHLDSTNGRYLRDYVPKVLGLRTPDPRASMGTLSVPGTRHGHVVIEYRKFSGTADEAKRASWASSISARSALPGCSIIQDVVAIPNTLYIEQRRVIRTCFPTASIIPRSRHGR